MGLGGVLAKVSLISNTEPRFFLCASSLFGSVLAESWQEVLEIEKGRKESGFSRGMADDWFYV